jgi:hypothetical protein
LTTIFYCGNIIDLRQQPPNSILKATQISEEEQKALGINRNTTILAGPIPKIFKEKVTNMN